MAAAEAEEPSGDGNRYISLVETDHPVLEELFSSPDGEDEKGVEAALAELRQRCEYGRFTGFLSFNEVAERWSARNGPRLRLNCGTLATLVVAWLRRTGHSAADVWALIGEPRDRRGSRGLDMHAWVLARGPEGPVLVDTMDLVPRGVDGAAVFDRIAPTFAFNDHRLVFGHQECRRRLLAGGRELRMYAYGHVEPEMGSMLGNRGLRAAVRSMLGSTATVSGEPDWLRDAIDLGLVERQGDQLTVGPRLILVDGESEARMREGAEPFLATYLEVAEEVVPELRRSYEACSAAGDFGWDAVEHAVVAGLWMDLAVGAVLHLRRNVAHEHGRSVVWAFERVSADNAFGVRWRNAEGSNRGMAQLWHRLVRRKAAFPPGRGEVEALVRSAQGEPVSRADELRLRHHGLIVGPRGHQRVAIPSLLPADCQRLLPVLLRGGERLVTGAVEPALESLRPSSPIPGFRTAAVRLLLEYATDRVIEEGYLSPFPRGPEPSVAWGRWLWVEGEDAELTLGAALADPETA